MTTVASLPSGARLAPLNLADKPSQQGAYLSLQLRVADHSCTAAMIAAKPMNTPPVSRLNTLSTAARRK